MDNELIRIDGVAIIGMSCRFPGAENIHEFWQNLQNGKESRTSFSKEVLAESGVAPSVYNSSNYVNSGCIIDNIEMFDPSFFGFTIEDAELMDPQQRLLITCAYEAMEDAGYASRPLNDIVGMFGGVRGSGYAKLLAPVLNQVGTLKYFKALLGNAVDQASMRTAYALDLKGPSIGVQTVCSTSLVAVHLACESLKNGECDMALAGASSIYVPQKQGYLYDERVNSSPDGHCRAFDSDAKGAMAGNGAGVILLKRFENASRDRDNIYAVIRGSAVNNDGSEKAGYRVPSVDGQARVIGEALEMAEIDPETIDYVEANGTGTLMGDMIEIEALKRALHKQPGKSMTCNIGSVKTNIGHLTQAAGMAGLIKTVLSLKHGKIPPSLNCLTPNPVLKDACLQVITRLCPWEQKEHPRRAGVSAFAIGGTNAHLVLEERGKTAIPNEEKRGSAYLFTISAKTENALHHLIERYLSFLENTPHASIAEICHTTNVGRTHFSCRMAAAVDSTDRLHEKLRESLANMSEIGKKSLNPGGNTGRYKICFSFPGQSVSHFNTLEKFYHDFPLFKQAIDNCDVFVRGNHHFSILPALFKGIRDEASPQARAGIFALEYAMAKMLSAWGILPSVVTGRGVGEYVAASVAGMMTYKDSMAILLSSEGKHRHQTRETTDPGGERLRPGPPEMELLVFDDQGKAEKEQILTPSYWLENKPLLKKGGGDISALLHKKEVDCIIEPERLLYHCRSQACNFPGALKTRNETQEFMAKEVDISTIEEADTSFLEFKHRFNSRDILQCMALFYCHGVDLNWKAFHMESNGRRTSLPTYPFENIRCWYDGEKNS